MILHMLVYCIIHLNLLEFDPCICTSEPPCLRKQTRRWLDNMAMNISRLVVIRMKKVGNFKYLGSLWTNKNSILDK